jgi:AcrR family transcriptional regulator
VRRTALETREHLLEVAHDLFYWHGIRSTGVDTIAESAKVAPTTLYRQFASKDDLVAAYVIRANRLYRDWFESAISSGDQSPKGRIAALFDALYEELRPTNFRGCPFLMALAEYPDPDSAVHKNAAETKAWVRHRLTELADDLTSAADLDRDPRIVGDQLMLVLEGTYASAQELTRDGPALVVAGLVESILMTAGT